MTGTENDGTDGADRGEVGSVGEEAVKLLAALQDWAGKSGGEYAGAATGAAASAASALGAVNEHIATGAEECRYCPVCRLIASARGTSPEVRQHLAAAASSLMQAVAGVMATHTGPDTKAENETGVEKIDLTDDDWEDD